MKKLFSQNKLFGGKDSGQDIKQNLEEESRDMKMDGRDIGDRKPIRESDPEIEQTIDTGIITEDSYIDEEIAMDEEDKMITGLQERDIGRGEGTDGMPLIRKEMDDQTDEYQIKGENIEDIPIGKKQESEEIKMDNQQQNIGDIRRKNEESPKIEYPTI